MPDREHRHSIEQLYDQTYRQLRVYSLSVLRDDRLAGAAVQETFRLARTGTEELLSSPNPCGWLMNTLRTVIRGSGFSEMER